MHDLSIGQVAQQSGVKIPTIRYYEDQGLLPAPIRSEGNRRLYGKAHVTRLVFVRHARELGFPPSAIRDLLVLSDQPDVSCSAADSIARVQLAAVEARLAQLTALRGELHRMIAACAGGQVANCRVIESLADHAHCDVDHHGIVAAD
jgi:DNA-binding transcriptional MerR regulator